MKAKIFVYALLVLILTTIHLAEGQQVKKVPRIGYVSSGYGPQGVSSKHCGKGCGPRLH